VPPRRSGASPRSCASVAAGYPQCQRPPTLDLKCPSALQADTSTVSASWTSIISAT
jgi:hypothetical protein